MPILAGRMPQMSVKNNRPGNSATPSGRKNRASVPIAGISTFASIILALVNNGVPVMRLMTSGALKSPLQQHPSNHPVKITMRNQGCHAGLGGAGYQNVG